jgi:hypothetical protein
VSPRSDNPARDSFTRFFLQNSESALSGRPYTSPADIAVPGLEPHPPPPLPPLPLDAAVPGRLRALAARLRQLVAVPGLDDDVDAIDAAVPGREDHPRADPPPDAFEAAVFGREFVLTVAPKELQRTSALVLSCIPLPALLAPLLGRLGPPPWLLPGRGGGRNAIRLR